MSVTTTGSPGSGPTPEAVSLGNMEKHHIVDEMGGLGPLMLAWRRWRGRWSGEEQWNGFRR